MLLRDRINSARIAAKNALTLLYDDVCTITAQEPVLDEATGITGYQESTLYENIPCRISFGTAASAAADEPAPGIEREIVLFLAPEINVPAGSKIIVTRLGVTTDYIRSGVPSVYATHQEIRLELAEDYA